MRKIRMTTAVLVLLLACQAVFAAFVPVEQADPSLIRRMAVMCDAVQRVALSAENPVAAYMDMASAKDEDIRSLAALYNLTERRDSVTTVEELSKIFPGGLEETDGYHIFRRAAIHMAFHTAKNGNLHATTPIQEAKEIFDLFGYGFAVELEGGDTVKFKFIDIYSADELAALVVRIGILVPNVTEASITRAGEFLYKTTGVSDFEFQFMVNSIKSVMYDYFMS